MNLRFLASLLLANRAVTAVSTFTPARPPAVPLAVKSPYLNTWLNADPDGSNHGILPGRWPQFWTESNTGWQGLIRVDGITYNWMGGEPGYPLVDQVALSYTSTRSTFIMNVGDKVEMNVIFMSPVYPDDLLKQSFTHSYLDVSVRAIDGRNHNIQVYADVSAEWASGDPSARVQWELGASDGLLFHKFYRQNQTLFRESNQQADWGNWYWATANTDGTTYQAGESRNLRGTFATRGQLADTTEEGFRSVNDRWPGFALARNLGAVSSTPSHVVWTIGYAQAEAINFLGQGSQPRQVPSLWTSALDEVGMLVSFYNDFDQASKQMTAFDDRIARDSIAAAGEDYLTITSLAVRQAFGALQFTGTTTDPLAFLKEISSDGDAQTVDVIYPTSAILIYLNPDLLRYVLEPLLLNQEAGHYPKPSAMHDLGIFPNALGYPAGNDEPMPLEESANMIIMMLAYAQRADDEAYLQRHADFLKRWADYLVGVAEAPAEQLSTDDFAGPLANQTNLAIKGIIGIKAMSVIAGLLGRADQAKAYADVADKYLDFWLDHAIDYTSVPPRAALQYGDRDTFTLLYNIFADRLLRLSFIPQSVYDTQSAFYPTVARRYGVPLDSRNASLIKADWEMFAAAAADDTGAPETRNLLIRTLATWINETPTWRAMTDLFCADSGAYPPGLQFAARPVVGGVFALLALQADGGTFGGLSI